MNFDGYEWTISADKHGIAHEDAVNTIVNPRLFVPNFDRSRIPGKGWAHLWIGRTVDGTVNLEVMGHFEYVTKTVEVFHVMPLREKTYNRAIKTLKERTTKR
ncbi:hypothetical protein ACFOYW_17025 [Gryllotalpicola reticulitermitis]|uniref:Uncharacterized protein n=1 Tax=Gryllotalpicola reticulitermitis TaxID=1184153 RepID=A0ABV8QBM6_9MICO